MVDWRAAPETIKTADLIINATSMGMIDNQIFHSQYRGQKKTALVIDIVYNPLITHS